MPAIWHSNPLASPPAKQPQLQLEPADGATTVRAMYAPEAAGAAAGPAAPAPAAADDEEEWQWESSAVASSPSLRLPACEPMGQPQAQQQQAVSQGSCGGGGGVESLSQQWDLPSVGAGNTT